MKQAEQVALDHSVPFVDLRAAPRSSLMCRTAKILCESGEYVCVVRDVSATGTRLRLFHAPPPDRHLFLELANGERYAMERVWEHDGHAGFRFSCTIDVARFIAEPNDLPRRPVRLKLQCAVEVIVDGAAVPAALVDISQQGACIEAGRKLALEQKLWLAVPGQPRRFGAVRWRKGYSHGLVLQQSFRLDELAHHAFALQPFDGAAPSLARSA